MLTELHNAIIIFPGFLILSYIIKSIYTCTYYTQLSYEKLYVYKCMLNIINYALY